MSGMQDGAQLGGQFGGAIGAMIGDSRANEERRKQYQILQELYNNYGSINPLVQAQAEEAYNMGPSAYEGISAQMDPATRNAQLAALQELQRVGLSGGMDEQSRAQQAQALAASAQQQRAQQGALLNSFAARGMANSGASLGAALSAQQGAAQANAMGGLQAAADSRARQLAALRDSSALASQVRNQDYGQASDLAGARDRVAEYNTRNRQDVQGRNIDRTMQARQQTISNQLARAGGMAQTGQGKVGYYQSEEQRKRNNAAGMGTVWGGAAGAFLGGISDFAGGGMGGGMSSMGKMGGK